MLDNCCRPYTPDDYAQIQLWCKLRGFPAVPEYGLPKVGFIVHGVAAGFLYQTDSCFAILDGYLSHPFSDHKDRDTALDEITHKLLSKAKELGFKAVKCETKNPLVRARALKWGFVDLGTFSCLYQEL